jgi:hypothetical protein
LLIIRHEASIGARLEVKGNDLTAVENLEQCTSNAQLRGKMR